MYCDMLIGMAAAENTRGGHGNWSSVNIDTESVASNPHKIRPGSL